MGSEFAQGGSRRTGNPSVSLKGKARPLCDPAVEARLGGEAQGLPVLSSANRLLKNLEKLTLFTVILKTFLSVLF